MFTATLGLALVHKGASVSLKRAGDDVSRREALTGLCETIQSSLRVLSGYADEDAEAFDSYLKARSLPRSTDGEKSLRDVAVETAVLRAIHVPIASAKTICEALQQAEQAVVLSGQHLLTDIVGGALLMKGAVEAVLLNVDANVGHLSDEAQRSSLQQERTDLLSLSKERSESVWRAYLARIEGFSSTEQV